MALFFKPHTVLVKTVSQSSADGQMNNLQFAEEVEVTGQITAKDSTAAFDTFGIESKQPHKFIFNIADAALFTIGSRVVWDNRTFTVSSNVRISKHNLPTDHAMIMLEQLDINTDGDI